MKTLISGAAGRKLRWLADSYEQAQRIRIEDGERIRAVLQGRDETWGDVTPEWELDPELDAKQAKKLVQAILSDIAVGKVVGPVPILGRTYARHYAEEVELQGEMQAVLKSHPAFPWLDEVKGIGPTLACKVLARLDIEKATHLSSFWAYCGLATVPASRYDCDVCGLSRSFPPSYKVTGKHKALGTQKNCTGQLELTVGPDGGHRCAQPRPARGEKATYDQYAKKIMYLVGTSFLKAGGTNGGSPYEVIYRRERARLIAERPGWADGRQHLTALRKIEKLFLAHLWMVWCEAIGKDPGVPYVVAEMGHDPSTMIDPWDMTGNAEE